MLNYFLLPDIHQFHSFLNQHTNKEDWGSNFHKNYINILKVINPIIPHFSNECLEKLNVSTEAIEWPEIDQKYLKQETFNIVTQINGKKRKVFSISKSVDKKTLIENIKKDEQIKKYLDNKQIIKTIYIENKLINFIIN